MVINKTVDGKAMNIALEGRLDTATAPDLEDAIRSDIDSISELVLDFENLDYISSAGLRVLLSSQNIMNEKGSMVVRNINDEIAEVFEITGFIDFLTIE